MRDQGWAKVRPDGRPASPGSSPTTDSHTPAFGTIFSWPVWGLLLGVEWNRPPASFGTAAAPRLTPKAESLDQLLVARRRRAAQIVEQPPALAHDLEQATAGVVVLQVDLEVLGELVDALGQDGDLDLGRSGVGLVTTIAVDDALLAFRCDQVTASISSSLGREGYQSQRCAAS